MADVYDPPDPKRPRRLRPFIAATVGADVEAALRAEHEKRGGAFAHAIEAALRKGLGLPDPSTT